MSRWRLTPPRVHVAEKHVIDACLDLLRLRGWWPCRIHTGTFRSMDGRRVIKGADKGTPDYAVLHERHPAFLLETKRPGSIATPDQINKHREIRIGYRLTIVTLDSVESLDAWLTNYEAATPLLKGTHHENPPD